MKQTMNKVTLRGVVQNAKILTKDDKSRVVLTIKDNLHGNRVQVTMWDRKNGITYDKKQYSLPNFVNLFINPDGSTKNNFVTILCTANEYQGNNQLSVLGVYPCNDESKQDMVFAFDGFITNVTGLDCDDDGQAWSNVKLITYTTRGKDKEKAIIGKNTVVVKVPKDEMELEEGGFISIDGEIISSYESDRFGRGVGKSITSYVGINVSTSDADDFDIALLKEVKKLELYSDRQINIAEFKEDYDE